ncbi:Zinc transporter [Coniosporium tulheliwenetii]|uniref:Zinc transporter n=1 Tax=Coniosporium tulheliwenetii TaxID=3383036 RepID=A0ACC2YW05_9PEZI|nr:Zinc transporter [Cladosporium sp. JES 115]
MSKIVSRSQHKCDENGQCFGYSDPCGQDCFKNIQARGGTKIPPSFQPRQPGLMRSATAPYSQTLSAERQPLLPDVEEEAPLVPVRSETQAYGTTSPPSSGTLTGSPNAELSKTASAPPIQPDSENEHGHVNEDNHEHHHDDYHEGHGNQPHHHHVPTNAFLSIGLQTSIAIALHKLPEGFITYATNHANPKLGFAVFLALFIHNITEGFAMALPLYLAINSRWKAMFWSSLLGGASQPLGAGVAALWFRLAGSGNMQPGEGFMGGCLLLLRA